MLLRDFPSSHLFWGGSPKLLILGWRVNFGGKHHCQHTPWYAERAPSSWLLRSPAFVTKGQHAFEGLSRTTSYCILGIRQSFWGGESIVFRPLRAHQFGCGQKAPCQHAPWYAERALLRCFLCKRTDFRNELGFDVDESLLPVVPCNWS